MEAGTRPRTDNWYWHTAVRKSAVNRDARHHCCNLNQSYDRCSPGRLLTPEMMDKIHLRTGMTVGMAGSQMLVDKFVRQQMSCRVGSSAVSGNGLLPHGEMRMIGIQTLLRTPMQLVHAVCCVPPMPVVNSGMSELRNTVSCCLSVSEYTTITQQVIVSATHSSQQRAVLDA